MVPPELTDAHTAGCSLAEVWDVAIKYGDAHLSLYEIWKLVTYTFDMDPEAEASHLISNADTLPKVDTKLIFVMSVLMARLDPDSKLEFCQDSDEMDFIAFMNAFCGWNELLVSKHWCAIPPVTCAKCLRLISRHWPEHAEAFFRMLEQIELAYKASQGYGGPFYNELSNYLKPRYNICLEYVIHRLGSGTQDVQDEDLSILELVEHHFFSSIVHLFFPMHLLTELEEIQAVSSFLQGLALNLSGEAVGIAQGGRELWKLIKQRENLPEAWRRFRCAEGFNLPLLQAQLEENQVVLYYLPLPTGKDEFNCVVWGITRSHVQLRTLAVDLTLVEALISSCEDPPWRNSDQSNWIDAALHLGAVLLSPLEPLLLPCHHVLVIAQGELARLPFHVLLWKGKPLIMSRTVSFGSSLSELALVRQTKVPTFAKTYGAATSNADPSQGPHPIDGLVPALVICNPRFMQYHMGFSAADSDTESLESFDKMPELRFSAVAGSIVAAAFSPSCAVSVLSQDSAHRCGVCEALMKQEDDSIIEFSTHLHFNDVCPLDSAILLSDETCLRATQLMCCLSNPWLLNLSTCHSGRIDGGHAAWNVFEMAGLAGGAANVVSSLWPVWDSAALLLNAQLYVELAKGSRLPLALQNAMLHVAGMGKRRTLIREAEHLSKAHGSSCELGQMLGNEAQVGAAAPIACNNAGDTVLSEEDRSKLKSFCHPGYWAYPRLPCKFVETDNLKAMLRPSGSTQIDEDLLRLIEETDLSVKQFMLSGILMHFISQGQISDMVNILTENSDCLDIQGPCCGGLTPLQYAVQEMAWNCDDTLPLPFGVDLLEALIELGSSPGEMTHELRCSALSNNKMSQLMHSNPILEHILFSAASDCQESGEQSDEDSQVQPRERGTKDNCGQLHGLMQVLTLEKSFVCDLCEQCFVVMHSCRTCDWDVCHSCFTAEATA